MSHLDSARVDTLVFPEQQRAAQVATPGGHRQLRTPWKTLHKSTVRRRVPVLLQMNAVECGAACLAMILTYYGRQTGISEIREQCGIGREACPPSALSRRHALMACFP